MAEDERKRIRERQKEGITIALQKGVKLGRKKVKIDNNFKEAYQEWKNHEITAVEAMQRVGMKSNTFYRRVKEYEHNLEEKKLFYLRKLLFTYYPISIEIIKSQINPL
nr:DNA recombinase [Bacillus thuringiensis]